MYILNNIRTKNDTLCYSNNLSALSHPHSYSITLLCRKYPFAYLMYLPVPTEMAEGREINM